VHTVSELPEDFGTSNAALFGGSNEVLDSWLHSALKANQVLITRFFRVVDGLLNPELRVTNEDFKFWARSFFQVFVF
jgi:hypothetical protein